MNTCSPLVIFNINLISKGMPNKHGQTGTKEYHIWTNIKYRCYNQNCTFYDRYGGRGIRVCDRWINSYENFINDMGPRPSPKHSIDRIDNSGDYSPDNCKWATAKEQTNNRRSSKFIEYNGVTRTATQWAEHLGMKRGVIIDRLGDGWSVERALTTSILDSKFKTGNDFWRIFKKR